MLSFSKRLTKNFAIDFCFFHKVRDFSDGFSLLELDLNADWYKGDHNPRFSILLIACNFSIVDICLYNVNHAPIEDVIVRCPECEAGYSEPKVICETCGSIIPKSVELRTQRCKGCGWVHLADDLICLKCGKPL